MWIILPIYKLEYDMGTEMELKKRKEILSLTAVVLSAFIAALLLRILLFEPMKVPTGSMTPTIKVNDSFYVNKLSFKLSPIKRKDIIVFRFPDNPSERYIKRVIGLGEEEVLIKNSRVYINGNPLDEPYINEPMSEIEYGPYKVPKDHYFVLGDNRNDSLDSRF
jgi:signal peptidase I